MNTDAANNAENKEMSFREAMAELDRTVAVLESNTLELEDSLKFSWASLTLPPMMQPLTRLFRSLSLI